MPTTKRATRYLFVLVRWMLILGGVFALTAFSGLYVINHVLPKEYQATALIELPAGDLVTPTTPRSILVSEPLPPEFENTMMSPEFLLAVVKDLGLDKEWAKRLYKSDEEQLPDVDALTHIENVLSITVEPGTHIVRIRAASDVPQEAADIANAVAERYKTMRDEAEVGGNSIRDQIAQQQRVVDDKRAVLEKMRQELAQDNYIENPGAFTTKPSQEQIAQLESFRKVKLDFEHEETLLAALSLRLHQGSDTVAVRILQRAEAPTEPSRPHRRVDSVVALVLAGFLSVTAASFVEIVFLFVRAGERAEG